jgi:hypothetical protein
MNDTDHDNPAVQALIAAATAVDEQLPGAWARLTDYLEAYGESDGTPLGKRRLDDDHIAELRVDDLRTVTAALETMLEAHTGPDEPDTTMAVAATDRVFYADHELRAHVEGLARDALLELAELRVVNAVDWGRIAENVTAAVWAAIERMGFAGAAALAVAEADEHEEGCHGRLTAETIAETILHGDDSRELERDACSGALESEQEGVGLADLDAKLDELLKRTAPDRNPGHFFYFDEDGNRVEGEKPIEPAKPTEVFIKLDGKLSEAARAKLKAGLLSGGLVCDTGNGVLQPPALATGGVLTTRGTATARDLIGMIEDSRIGDGWDLECFTAAFLGDGRLHHDAIPALADGIAQLLPVVVKAMEAMGAEGFDEDEEDDRG